MVQPVWYWNCSTSLVHAPPRAVTVNAARAVGKDSTRPRQVALAEAQMNRSQDNMLSSLDLENDLDSMPTRREQSRLNELDTILHQHGYTPRRGDAAAEEEEDGGDEEHGSPTLDALDLARSGSVSFAADSSDPPVGASEY